MADIERYLDVCECCESRELDFIFFDISRQSKGAHCFLKDIPAFRCRECGEVLISEGVLEIIDDIKSEDLKSCYFPALKYQKKILGLDDSDRDLVERYLHSWNMVRADGRICWNYGGFRRFCDWKEIANN